MAKHDNYYFPPEEKNILLVLGHYIVILQLMLKSKRSSNWRKVSVSIPIPIYSVLSWRKMLFAPYGVVMTFTVPAGE